MKLQIEFDREQLHSSILGAMRKLGFPANMEGYDLIRGTAFGKIDHPEYCVRDAILRATEMTQMPSKAYTYEEAIQVMFYCIESSRISEKEINDDEAIVVGNVVKEIIVYVRNDYYRKIIMQTLKNSGFRERDIKFELLFNMIYKALSEEDSKEECILLYAYRKTYVEEPKSLETAKERIIGCLGTDDWFETVQYFVTEIFENYPTTTI